MFAQTIPGSEKTMDEFWNEPLEKVQDNCFRCMGNGLNRQQALNAFDSDPESFNDAFANAWKRLSDERKAQRLRRSMETMTETSLLTMRVDHSSNQRTLHDIDEELHDRTVRERIAAAAVRAIENDTRKSWDDSLPESDRFHTFWKRCDRFVRHGENYFCFDPSSNSSLLTYDFLCNTSKQPTLSAVEGEQACMNRVKNAKQLA